MVIQISSMLILEEDDRYKKVSRQLHRDAGVPEGPCGIEELEKFQTFLGRQGYKIIVVDCVFCYHLSRQRG